MGKSKSAASEIGAGFGFEFSREETTSPTLFSREETGVLSVLIDEHQPTTNN